MDSKKRKKENAFVRTRVISTTTISGPETRKGRYHNFLKSSHWQKLRRKKLRKHGSCFICLTRENLHVHHNGYENAFNAKVGKALKDTYTLCGGCHNAVHKVQRERGLKWEETGPIIQEFKEQAKQARKERRESYEEFSQMMKHIV